MGQHVRISPIAISHGNLSIEIKAPVGQQAQAAPAAAGQQAAQGPALSLPEQTGIVLFKGEVDLKEVVDGLNKIGASTGDLVQVLKIIKAEIEGVALDLRDEDTAEPTLEVLHIEIVTLRQESVRPRAVLIQGDEITERA